MRDKIFKWLDRNGDGKLSPDDVRAGAKQASAAVRNSLDRNGDGQLTTDDIKLIYADVFDEKVRKAASILPFLVTQPLGYLGLFVLLGSVYASFIYYSTIFPDGGTLFGTMMALVALMGLFAMNYYTGIAWRFVLDKLIALTVICGIAVADIVAFAGLMSYNRDVEHNRRTSKAMLTKDDQGDLKSILERKKVLRGSGVPRPVADVQAELTLEGERYFCRARADWCKIANYCVNRPRYKKCRKFTVLHTELVRSREWQSLLAQERELAAATTQGETISKTDIHAETVAKVTGFPKVFAAQNVDRWQAMLLEALVMAVFYLVTSTAHRQRARRYEATLALQKAKMQKADATVTPSNPAPETVEPIPRPNKDQMADAAQQQVPENTVNVAINDLWRWRENGLVENVGAWMSREEAYAGYVQWSRAENRTPVDVDEFHKVVMENRLIVSVSKDGVDGYAGMALRTPVMA